VHRGTRCAAGESDLAIEPQTSTWVCVWVTASSAHSIIDTTNSNDTAKEGTDRLNDAAVANDDDGVRVLDRAETVRDHKRGAAAARTVQRLLAVSEQKRERK
jgi:hypothetical protein